jgi:hypothetical protein
MILAVGPHSSAALDATLGDAPHTCGTVDKVVMMTVMMVMVMVWWWQW